jgi:transcriptional regulator GlxA family with amidase domain
MNQEPVLGVVLFPGFELLDVAGPLSMMMYAPGLRTVLLARHAGPIPCSRGPAMVAEQSLAAAPALDILLVPGGVGTRTEVDNPELIAFLRERGASTPVVASVCTGAGLLARAGLLDGVRATTNKAAFAWPVSQGPAVRWVKEARWVHDGRFWTSSGVAAGIDMSLALIAEHFGTEVAERIATQAEYVWQRDAQADPFAKLHGLV